MKEYHSAGYPEGVVAWVGGEGGVGITGMCEETSCCMDMGIRVKLKNETPESYF